MLTILKQRWLWMLGLAWAILWPLLTPVWAQEPHIQFEHLSLEQGLSHSTVYSIVQDQRGFLWFGTQSGLNRYDGYKLKVFQHDAKNPFSISNDNAGNLFIDHEGILWIGTWGGGLNRFDPQTERATNYMPKPQDSSSLSSDRVQTVFEDRQHTLWIGTGNGGLNKFDRQTQKFTRYQNDPAEPSSLSHDRVWSIVQDKAGSLWVGTSEGLNKFDPKTETFRRYLPTPAGLSNAIIRNLLLDKQGLLWVGTDDGLNKFNPQTEKFTVYKNQPNDPTSISDNVINDLLEDSSGNFWVGTGRGGLNLLNRQTGEFTRYQNDSQDNRSLSYDDIRSIYEDSSGVLWLATRGGGVNKLLPNLRQFRYFTQTTVQTNTLSSNDVRAIYVAEDQTIWLGTKGGGLNKYEPASRHFTVYKNNPNEPQSLSHDDVYAIAAGEKGVLWLGTAGGGLNKFDPQTAKFKVYKNNPKSPKSLSSNDLYTLYPDPLHPNYLWLGTKGGGLSRFDSTTEQFTNYQFDPTDAASLSGNDVFALLRDSQGRLWVGTYGGGLNYFDEKAEQFVRYQNQPDRLTSLTSNDIYAIYEDEQKKLWVATSDGLEQFDPKTNEFHHYTEAEGLPSSVVYSILPDKLGNLWLSTSRAITRFNPKNKSFMTFDTSDGLESINYNDKAAYISRQGELFFGGINGLLVFKPAKLKFAPNPPRTVLTGLNLPHTNLNELKEITLSAEDKTLALEFAALDYANPARNQYRSMLEGFDKDWVNNPHRFATYTNLDPQTYTFRVKSANNAGLWDQKGLTIKVIVLPPFWETWWFRILSALSLMVFVFVAYRGRVRRMKLNAQRLENLVQQRTLELSNVNQNLKTLNTRLQDELSIARETQQSLLLPPKPNWPDITVCCFSTSAFEVGGDFYVYHQNQAAQHNHYALAVGDVSGKGMPAALLMAVSVTAIQTLMMQDLTPKQLLAQLDTAIRPYTYPRRQNCALCYVEITVQAVGRQVRVVNAGCITPIVRQKNSPMQWLEVSGLPIGTLLSNVKAYPEVTLQLEQGDLIILCSDGLIEAMTVDKIMFGFERMEQAVNQAPTHSAEAMSNFLQAEIAHFVGQAEPNDDLTLVVIQL